MKALVLEKKELGLREIPQPLPSENEALIKVLKAGICNTDLELLKGYMEFKGILGHEFIGRVVQSPDESWTDKRVVGEINIACRKCEFCREGNSKHCPLRGVLGIFNVNGAFAEFLTLPVENLHLLPQGISDIEAVFIEPLAAALEIFDEITISREESVLVLGDGKLGLLIAQIMKLKTDRVHCLGRHERKLEILKKKEIKTHLRGTEIEQEFDVVVEATGNAEGVKEALSRVKPRGKVVLKSTFRDEAKLDISKIVVDEIQLIGSRCGPFAKAIEVLERKLVDVTEMIDGDFPLDRAEEAFTMAEKPEIMKVLITP